MPDRRAASSPGNHPVSVGRKVPILPPVSPTTPVVYLPTESSSNIAVQGFSDGRADCAPSKKVVPPHARSFLIWVWGAPNYQQPQGWAALLPARRAPQAWSQSVAVQARRYAVRMSSQPDFLSHFASNPSLPHKEKEEMQDPEKRGKALAV
ncbi:hypothetical protein OG21DRAFT_1603621 [Imleria badia]|nr:hypothetical protein OG21DRAFT_1603621 [Imleria badia]